MSRASTSETVRPATPYDRIGGDRVVGAIVNRFYDLIEGDTAYAAVRATHGADFTRLRGALQGYLVAWLGGPRDYFTQGGPCMVSVHGRVRISQAAADQWAAAMAKAIAEQPEIDREIGPAMAEALGGMARQFVNCDDAAPGE